MLYFLCIVFPPAAILLTGRIASLGLNLLLCLCFYIPAIIHAFGVVSDYKASIRNDKLIKAIKKNQ
jgi:uncharacterized membrane protein YqaE (UPF0057 family)